MLKKKPFFCSFPAFWQVERGQPDCWHGKGFGDTGLGHPDRSQQPGSRARSSRAHLNQAGICLFFFFRIEIHAKPDGINTREEIRFLFRTGKPLGF